MYLVNLADIINEDYSTLWKTNHNLFYDEIIDLDEFVISKSKHVNAIIITRPTSYQRWILKDKLKVSSIEELKLKLDMMGYSIKGVNKDGSV